MTFKFLENRGKNRHAQNFDKDNISITKAGKTYNVYEAIQAATEDTEIYPTLEKYGCLDRITYEPKDAQSYYQDIRNIKDLRSSIDQVHEAENMWLGLPLEIRQKFNHSVNEFMDKGESWLKNEIKTYQEKQKQNTITNEKTEVTENEQK